MIDPYLQAVMDALRDSGMRYPDPIDAAALRAMMDNPMPGPPLEIDHTRDFTLTTADRPIAARLYHPAPGEKRPLLMFFHGGGWVIGSIATHDRLAAALAARSGCALVSVDYRLAPEHVFPAALDDCVAATRATLAMAEELGVDGENYGVAGDSAGGNLAAAAAQRLAGDSIPPRHQLLIYPVIEAAFARPSYATAPKEGFLPPQMMEWFWDQYAPGDLRRDPGAAPILADSLAGLPPATVIVAGNDPLHDEGVAYAEQLIADGVAVELLDYPTAVHGFASMIGVAPIADEAVNRAAELAAKAMHLAP